MKMRVLGAAALLLVPASAAAQLILDPSGQTPPPQGAPPNPYVPGAIGVPGAPQPAPPPPTPPQIYINLPQGGTVPADQAPPPGTPAEPEGLYLGPVPGAESGVRYQGEELPDVHVVQKGDTLWDVCAYYLGDPWRWPQIWGLNPTISNPHWIYPGEVVKLKEGAEAPQQVVAAPATQPQQAPSQEPPALIEQAPTAVELRQLAFVSAEDLKVAGKVTGAKEEKAMLSLLDEVYLDYPAGQPPQVGRRYAIYAPTREIKHPETGRVIGHYVLVKGTVEIREVKKDKRAVGVITQVHDFGFVERGERVGTLKTQFRTLDPVPADRNLEGVVVGVLGTDNIIGDWQIVFLDRGANDGVKVGNQMQVVRRGDAYPQERGGDLTPAGMDDRRYPDNYIGTILVLDTGKTTSLGLVTRVDKEILVGDHVLMRKPN